MKLQDIKEAIAEETDMPLSQNKDKITRKISQALEALSTAVRWPFAIKDMPNKTLRSGGYYVDVNEKTIFRPVSVTIILGSGKRYALDYMNYSDFRRVHDTQTENIPEPERYSYANQRLYIGPGLISGAATIRSSFQRKLTLRDVELIPDGNVIVEKALTFLYKRGSDEWILADKNYEVAMRNMINSFKITAVEKGSRPLDKQIRRNQSYIRTIRRRV